MIRSRRSAHFLVRKKSGSQWCMVHSDSSFGLGFRSGSILRTKDSSAVGNNHRIVALSCAWIPGAQLHHGKSRQLAVVAVPFSAGCGVWVVDAVEPVVQMAAASCRHIAGARLPLAVMQRDLSRAVPAAVTLLAAVVVGVDQPAAAAAAAAAAAVEVVVA